MATPVVKIVDPDNGGGTHYTSLDAWEDALGGTTNGNLPGADETATAQCRNSSGSGDTAEVDIDGWTTDATRDITIEAYTGYRHAGKWNDAKYRLEHTDGALGLCIREDFVTVDGIQIHDTVTPNNSVNGIREIGANAGAQRVISNLIIKATCAGTGGGLGLSIADADGTWTISNLLIYDFVSGVDTGFKGINIAGGTINLTNCTIHNCYIGIYVADGATVDFENTVIFDCTNDIDGTPDVMDYCATDDGDGTNAIAPLGADWDNEFTSYGTDDFSLKAGGNCIDIGNDNPLGDGSGTPDIAGNARGTWDCGAFEYVAAGGVTLVLDDLAHAHALDNVVLTQAHTIVVQDLTSAHALDAVALTQAHTLAVAELVHSHALDGLTLTQAHLLAVEDLLHGHALDALAISQVHILVVDDLGHGHALDAVALTQAHTLAVADLLHGHTLDSVSFSVAHGLLTITFSARAPGIRAAGHAPGITAEGRAPRISAKAVN